MLDYDLEEPTEVTLKTLFDEFIDDAIVKNLSKRTITYYTYCYKWLTKTISSETMIDVITKQNIKNHIRFLMKTNKATSVNCHLTGLRVIFNYANENYGTSIKIKLIKTDRQPKPTYSDDELKKLLKKPDINNCPSTEYRNWVMINVFVATGCRLGSCINVRMQDIDFSSNTIFFVKMKNRKALLLPLNDDLRAILLEYFSKSAFKPDDCIFPSLKGKMFTDTGFCATFRDYAAKRNVIKAGIHKFRHTYAKQFILSGGNPAKLQRILGHSSIEITMQYVNLYSVDLKDDINSYCFLNKLKKDETVLL